MYWLKNRVERLVGELKSLLVVRSQAIEQMEMRKGIVSFPCDIEKITDGYEAFENGALWSEPELDNYVLFRFSVRIPEEYHGKRVILRIATNQGGGHNMIRPQMLAYLNGEAVQGLDVNHEYMLLSDSAEAGKEYRVHVYAFSGMPVKTPYGGWVEVNKALGVRLHVHLQETDRELNDYYYNIRTPLTYLNQFEEKSYEYETILNALNDSLSELDLRDPHSEAFRESVKKANGLLAERLYSKIYPDNGTATMIGHTHIDLAWLWQYKHTRDKGMRSFATAVKMLGEHEKHVFMSSQAQLYAFVKESQPELYRKIQELVQQGRWEVEGAMWCEPDMNLVSGESIVRQILYGKRFFREEFQVDCKVLWLPDVFGYSAALPQILKKSGLDYFMTGKLMANQLNRFPFDTFMWEGIDGSAVLAQLARGYNPNIEGGSILQDWKKYAQKDINDNILVPFGFADGGGGPTTEQIESIKRLEKGLPGLPKTKFGKVGEFFTELEEKVSGNRRLPVYAGEIYFENHRGTYTSMARIKKKNRKVEFLYMNAEWLWSLASLFGGEAFPKEQFDKGMKNILLNQFHDVLPGTSIRQVYEDADALYEESFEIGRQIAGTAVNQIVRQIGADVPSVAVFNPYGEAVDGYVNVDGKLQFVRNVPAKGYGVYAIADELPKTPVTVTGDTMENEYYILKISPSGFIAQLYDKTAGRQCFRKNEDANRIRVFEDKPTIEDNWNLDPFYTEKEYDMPAPTEISVMESGGHCGRLRVTWHYQKSVIQQDIILYADSPRIDFVTEIDWKEHSQIVRTDFPVDVNARKATYEVQFGHLERPNTKNNAWEEARFEVCGHKWADISDNGYGMSLLNDCKYGYSAEGSVLSMTLLRSGNVPNPIADKELNKFTYSILPHRGSFIESNTVKEAYMLNNPLFAVPVCEEATQIPESFSMFACEGAVLETVKPAEDENGLILRLYEANNSGGNVKIACGFPIGKAEFCDLMESPLEDGPAMEYDSHTGTITFPIKPFEIITLRIER